MCLIRLAQVRPRLVPSMFGLTSENAAHRIAVEWDTPNGMREGVFIPRRDTSSWFNTVVGGRLFPGQHHRARFDVRESADDIRVALRSVDGRTQVVVEASVAPHLPDISVFRSVEEASAFFERGSIGYSATTQPGFFDCLELRCQAWHVTPLAVRCAESSFFSNTAIFPPGSVNLDSALLMRGIPHEWRPREPMRSEHRHDPGQPTVATDGTPRRG